MIICRFEMAVSFTIHRRANKLGKHYELNSKVLEQRNKEMANGCHCHDLTTLTLPVVPEVGEIFVLDNHPYVVHNRCWSASSNDNPELHVNITLVDVAPQENPIRKEKGLFPFDAESQVDEEIALRDAAKKFEDEQNAIFYYLYPSQEEGKFVSEPQMFWGGKMLICKKEEFLDAFIKYWSKSNYRYIGTKTKHIGPANVVAYKEMVLNAGIARENPIADYVVPSEATQKETFILYKFGAQGSESFYFYGPKNLNVADARNHWLRELHPLWFNTARACVEKYPFSLVETLDSVPDELHCMNPFNMINESSLPTIKDYFASMEVKDS